MACAFANPFCSNSTLVSARYKTVLSRQSKELEGRSQTTEGANVKPKREQAAN